MSNDEAGLVKTIMSRRAQIAYLHKGASQFRLKKTQAKY